MAAVPPPPAYDPVNPEFPGQTLMHWNFEHGFNITRALCRALHAEQMDTYEQLGRLTKDDLDDLFESMKRPGGPVGTGTVTDRRSSNPGIRVSFVARQIIAQTVYAVRHFNRIQRPVDPTLITQGYLQQMHELKLKEERLAEKDIPPMPPVMKDETKIRQTVMDIRLHLQKRTGGTGIPLIYVIRRNEAVDNSIVYNGVGSVQEMIDRAPLTGHIYDTDNAAVWEVIATVIPPSVPFYVWIRSFETTENGRAAYMQIITRHMGGRAAKNIVATAKNMLRTKYFDNTKPQHFPFDKFVNLHKRAHMDIDLYDERPILESEKIDYLVSGVTAQELVHTCATINLNVNNEFSNFDAAVSALQSELHRQEGVRAHRKRTISSSEQQEGNADETHGDEHGEGEEEEDSRDGNRSGQERGRDGRDRGGHRGRGQGRGRGQSGRGRGNDQTGTRGGGYIPQEQWNQIMERKRKREQETQDEIEQARRSAGATESSIQDDQDESQHDHEDSLSSRSASSMTRRVRYAEHR